MCYHPHFLVQPSKSSPIPARSPARAALKIVQSGVCTTHHTQRLQRLADEAAAAAAEADEESEADEDDEGDDYASALDVPVGT